MKLKRNRALAALLALLCLLLAACGGSSAGTATESGSVRLTFAESIDVKRINSLSGKTVEIVGYMATVSPVNGSYIYLMNLPYQSCPYCVPNTQQLSNTIAVYAKKGDRFEFYDGPINVTGTLETGDFSDEYGYTYNYRIADAVYSTVDSKEASEKLALWSRITEAGLASEVYSMFDFLDFECNWPHYRAKFQEGEAYLYPADVKHFEEGSYATQNAEGYFDDLRARVLAIGDSRMDELAAIVTDAGALVVKAKAERDAGNYSYDKDADQFTLTNGKALVAEALCFAAHSKSTAIFTTSFRLVAGPSSR